MILFATGRKSIEKKNIIEVCSTKSQPKQLLTNSWILLLNGTAIQNHLLITVYASYTSACATLLRRQTRNLTPVGLWFRNFVQANRIKDNEENIKIFIKNTHRIQKIQVFVHYLHCNRRESS